MNTNFYIDGFNLYNRAVKDTPYKWLDLSKVCQLLTPTHQINHIRYFTAWVDARGDAQRRSRQQIYLRALETLPNLTVHFGEFRTQAVSRPLVRPVLGRTSFVEVWDTKEKGTDVNLATFLLVDGFQGDYDQAVVISNDADLALPMRMVRDILKRAVGIVNPNVDPTAITPRDLTGAATFTRRLKTGTLQRSQFPPMLTDQHGAITKPPQW